MSRPRLDIQGQAEVTPVTRVVMTFAPSLDGTPLTLRSVTYTLRSKENLIPQLEAKWRTLLKEMWVLTSDLSSSETTG